MTYSRIFCLGGKVVDDKKSLTRSSLVCQHPKDPRSQSHFDFCSLPVPTAPPPNVVGNSFQSTEYVSFTWGAIPPARRNGQLQGYLVRYWIAREDGKSSADLLIKKKRLDKHTYSIKLKGYQTNTLVGVTVSGFSSTGEGPRSEIVTAG